MINSKTNNAQAASSKITIFSN